MFFPSLDNGAVAAITLVCIGIFLVASGFWARKYPNGNLSLAYQWIWFALKVAGYKVVFAILKMVQFCFNNLCARCTESDRQNDDRQWIPMDNAISLSNIIIQQPYPENLNP